MVNEFNVISLKDFCLLYKKQIAEKRMYLILLDLLSTSPLIPLEMKPSSEDGFPTVYPLVRGTPGTMELLYRKIQQEIPAVILKGTGSAADIIAFAYEEINAK